MISGRIGQWKNVTEENTCVGETHRVTGLAALQCAKTASALGVDAVLVQDLGL